MSEPVMVDSGRAREEAALSDGALTLKGRVRPASNLTFLAEATLHEVTVRCVYKPVAGERPLWDFPDGTLAAREVAAYAVSEALGWDVVPLTVLREGPAGAGMVQAWREPDRRQAPVDVVPQDHVPDGYLHVLDAYDVADIPVSLVHEDTVALRRMAVFDVVVNNGDRKGGHVLPRRGGHRYGVDHGVSFHVENKLRTVLWGWAGEPLTDGETAGLGSLAQQLTTPGALLHRLQELLTGAEMDALRHRTTRLLATGRLPFPSEDWPAIPWPAF